MAKGPERRYTARPMTLLALAALIFAQAPAAPAAAPAEKPKPTAGQVSAPVAAPAQAAAPAAKPEAVKPAAAHAQTSPAWQPVTSADGSLDFTAEVKLLYRVVACGGGGPVPEGFDAAVVDAHCAELAKRTDKYKKTWVTVASPWLQKLKPQGLPTTLVYPFGGGDLISALTTYPEATDLTTMSLEHAGDPRRIHGITAKELKASLELIRQTSAGLLTANDSKTVNLMKGQRGELPGQLSFFLIALAVHGFEPLKLRYVKPAADGSVKGITQAEITELEKKNAQLLRSGWTSPDFSEAFSNLEITFAKPGEKPRVHRHFAENLDDDHFGKDEPLQKYLDQKGRIVAMTKAASYLLWRDNFSKIRDYLIAHMEFMISDSTGIPPKYLENKGFAQTGYGKFNESFLGANPAHNADFRKIWSKAEPLPFRYGYIDKSYQFHLLVTQKAAKAQ